MTAKREVSGSPGTTVRGVARSAIAPVVEPERTKIAHLKSTKSVPRSAPSKSAARGTAGLQRVVTTLPRVSKRAQRKVLARIRKFFSAKETVK
jgi:hypothetical protein